MMWMRAILSAMELPYPFDHSALGLWPQVLISLLVSKHCAMIVEVVRVDALLRYGMSPCRHHHHFNVCRPALALTGPGAVDGG